MDIMEYSSIQLDALYEEEYEVQRMLDLYNALNEQDLTTEQYEALYLEYMELKGKYTS